MIKNQEGPGKQDYEDRLEELGSFSQEKRRLRKDLTAPKPPEGGYTEDRDRLFSVAIGPGDRTRCIASSCSRGSLGWRSGETSWL